MLHSFSIISLAFHIVEFPYDNGANIQGSRKGPMTISQKLFYDKTEIHITEDIQVDLFNLYQTNLKLLNSKKCPLTLGGDHSLSIGSVSASKQYCDSHDLNMGVLWCDAHLDFNTIETSPSQNLHGMSVAILCGHTLPKMCHSTKSIKSEQVCYFGVRDVDALEKVRFEKSHCHIASTVEDIQDWMKNFDILHLSIDIDVLDPTFAPGVNTPVGNGVNLADMLHLISLVPNEKMLSVDIVEYNPLQDKEFATLTCVMDMIAMLDKKLN